MNGIWEKLPASPCSAASDDPPARLSPLTPFTMLPTSTMHLSADALPAAKDVPFADIRRKALLTRLRAIDAKKAQLGNAPDEDVVLIAEKPAPSTTTPHRASTRKRTPSTRRRSTTPKRKGTTKGPPKSIPQQVIDIDADPPAAAPSALKKAKSSKSASKSAASLPVTAPKRQSTRVRRPRAPILLGLPKGHPTPMPSAMSKCKRVQFCKRLVTAMLKNHTSAPFSAPVNDLWPEHAIPSYFDVITNPMDLRTVKKKLETSVYLAETTDAFLPYRFEAHLFSADVRLIFRNAMVYNRLGDALYNCAQALMDDFNKTMREQLPLPPSPEEIAASLSKKKTSNAAGAAKSRKDRSRAAAAPSPPLSASNQMVDDDEVICLSDPLPVVTKAKKPSKKRAAAKPAPRYESIVDTMDTDELRARLQYLNDCRVPVLARTPVTGRVGYLTLASHLYDVPITYKEKCRITENLGKVPAGKLEALINMIKKSSQAQIDVRPEEFEFDMDSLDNATLRNIEAFLEQFIPGFKTVRSSTLGREFSTVHEVDEEVEAVKGKIGHLGTQQAEKPARESSSSGMHRVVRQPKSFFESSMGGNDSSSDESSDSESDSDSDSSSDESDAE